MSTGWFEASARVEAVMLGRLRAVCLAMLGSVPLAAIYPLFVMPSLAVAIPTLVSLVAALSVYLAVRAGRISARSSPALVSLLWLTAISTVIVGDLVYQSAAWSALQLALFVGLGTVQLVRGYLVIPLVAAAVAWLACSLAIDPLGAQISALPASLALAMLAHVANRSFVDNEEKLREVAEAKTREVEAALEAARHEMAERARAEQEREALREQFVAAQKMEAVGTLAGGLAHDVNNVLSGILGLAELIREGATPETAQADLDGIIAACRRGGEMTRNLVAFSRRGSYHRERLDLEPIARQVVSMVSRSAPKRIRIELAMTGALEVDGDAGQLAQVLLNLCVNSIDAIPGDGTVRVALQPVTVAADAAAELQAGDHVMIAVSDTGTGISEATRARMFEPFFTTKPLGAGTGLGLAMVYGTVKSHGGVIQVESQVGEGTTIRIYLPPATLPAAAPAEHERAARGRGRILVVDDEPVIRITNKRILERQGYEVEAAESGAQALECYARERFVAVVLDMSMPGMSGAECFRQLRGRDPSVRVLLVSGYAIQDEIRQCLADGARGFLAKPFGSAALVEAVAVIVRGERVLPAEG